MKNSLGVICGLIHNLKQVNEVPKSELAQLEFEAKNRLGGGKVSLFIP